MPASQIASKQSQSNQQSKVYFSPAPIDEAEREEKEFSLLQFSSLIFLHGRKIGKGKRNSEKFPLFILSLLSRFERGKKWKKEEEDTVTRR